MGGAAERGLAGASEGAAALAAVAGVAPDAEAEEEAGRHSAATAAEDFRRGRKEAVCADDDDDADCCNAGACARGSSGCSSCCCSAWPCCCKYASCMCSCSAGLTRSKLSSCCRSLLSLMLVRRREAGEMNESDCSAEDADSSTGVPGATPPCGRVAGAGTAEEEPVEVAPADTGTGADADPGPDAGGHSIRREMALTSGYICCSDAAPAPTAAPSVTGPPAEAAAI